MKIICFRPLQFCTGVVQKSSDLYYKCSFRPLQFCTGVVHIKDKSNETTCFRPLQFCTGVVLRRRSIKNGSWF